MKKRRLLAALVSLALGVTACGAVDPNEYYDYDNTSEEDAGMLQQIPLELPTVVAAEEFDETASEEAEPEDAQQSPEAQPEAYPISVCIGEGGVSLDPCAASSIEQNTYILHLFEGLMKHKPTKKIVYGSESVLQAKVVYGQAEAVDVSEDALTYTFHLRDGIYWSDGEAVSAYDFEYAWRRLVTPRNDCPYGYILNGIVENAAAIQAGELDAEALGATALDEKTFEVRLEQRCPYFLRMTASPYLVPLRPDIMEGLCEPDGGSRIVTNGIYEAAEYVPEDHLSLVPSEHYYAEAPAYTGVTFCFQTVDEAAKNFESGTLDLAADRYGDLDVQTQGTREQLPADTTNFLIFNTRNIKDWRVRAAITLAIDREGLAAEVFADTVKPLYGMTPYGITNAKKRDYASAYDSGLPMLVYLAQTYPDRDLTAYEERCALARELMDQCVREGTFAKSAAVRYVYNKSVINKRAAKYLKKCLSEVLELEVELSEQKAADYLESLASHSFDLARMSWQTDTDDPLSFVTLLQNNGYYNYGLFYNYEYENMLDMAEQLDASQERDSFLRGAEEAMFAENAFGEAPLFYTVNALLKGERVTRIFYSSLGCYFLM